MEHGERCDNMPVVIVKKPAKPVVTVTKAGQEILPKKAKTNMPEDYCKDCRLFISFPENCLKEKENNSPEKKCRMKEIIKEYGILLPVPMEEEEGGSV